MNKEVKEELEEYYLKVNVSRWLNFHFETSLVRIFRTQLVNQ